MSKIQDGTKVSICYVGKLDNGEIFKTVDETNPLTFTIGNSEAPPTLESTIKDMAVGEQRRVSVPPEESYGVRQKALLQTLPRDSFGKDINPKPGMILSLKVNKDNQEHKVPATVMEVEGDTVTVDYNHPLAGHTLTYELKLLSIE